jgi:hypothetical protein
LTLNDVVYKVEPAFKSSRVLTRKNVGFLATP